jgi:hypothetical protein
MVPRAGAVVRQDINGSMQLEVRSETSVQAAEIEAMVKARCALARTMPRDIDVARQKILADCRRPLFADKAIWSKPVGSEDLEGPSVRLAEAIMRHMGNMISDATIAEDTQERRRIRVYAMDLETNATASADIVISKHVERRNPKDREVISERTNTYNQKVFTVLATEDELLNKTNSAVSRMKRNKILEMVPADIVEEAMQVCNDTLAKSDAQDPSAARKKMVDSFLLLGVPAKELLAYVGHPLDVLSPQEIQQLRRVHNSIRDGEATWATIMEAKQAAQAAAPKAPPPAPAQSPVPPHDPQTGEVTEAELVAAEKPEDTAAAEAIARMKAADEAAKAATAKVVNAPIEERPPLAPQGQLSLDPAAGDVTEQVKTKMRAVIDDPNGTVEQLMKLAKLADQCPAERRKEIGTLAIEGRKVINGRKK